MIEYIIKTWHYNMQIYFIQDMNAYTVTALLYDTSMACAKYISDIQPARELGATFSQKWLTGIL